MNGSRSHSSRPGASGSSLDSLNRTIESLEARIETMLGRGDDGAIARQPATAPRATAKAQSAGLGSDLLEDIRARQRTLEQAPRGARGEASRSQRAAAPASIGEIQASLQDRKAATIPPASAAHRDPRPDLSQQLINEMTALRREMGELRAEARDQSLPRELRQDLAGISASIDALGTQDGGADALRLELDTMRSMVDQLAREDSVRSLENRWQSMEEQVSGLDMAALREELVNLAYRVDEIREFLSTLPPSGQGQAIEDKIVELSHAIEAMSRQSAAANPDFPAQFDMLGARLDEITRAISTMPANLTPTVDNTPFERLEARLASVAQKIDELEPSAVETEIGSRIEHLAARVAQLADEDAIARLDARIENLQSFIESGARENRMPELADYLSDITGKIEALDARGVDESLIARLDQLAYQIENLSAPAPQVSAVPDAVIGRLEALIGRAEETVSRSVDPLPGLETLDARLADIAHKLQQAEVTAAGNAMQPVNGLENVEAQLAEISARLDRPYIEQAPAMLPGIENLEARLADIAERLDMSSNAGAGPSDQAMRGLEDQISNLSRLISSAPASAGSEVFDERLASIEEHLATSDEFVVEAARQAAEAALSAYAGQMGSTPTPQSLANMEVITALADDLKALEGLSRKTEDRTTRAFEAVQETMLKIAGRLERLDAPAPVLPGNHAADAQAGGQGNREAVMPRTSTVPLDEAMQGIENYRDDTHQAGPAQDDYQTHPARTPSEAAALAAAYAANQEPEAEDNGASTDTGGGSEKSFLSGLAARIRPGKDTSKTQAEPHFAEDDSPPLDPSMEMDAETANMPLEPGSGAPDINRILQKVREAQAAERQRDGGPADNGAEKTEFLASARRAAMAAAAEVETIGKGRKSGGGMLEVLKSRRRPILMAAGAVLLAVMSYPLVSGLLSDGNEDIAIVEPAIVEPAAVEQFDAPEEAENLASGVEDQQPVMEARLPEVRVIEPGEEAPAETAEVAPPVPSSEATAAIAPQADPAPVADNPAAADETLLTAALDALPSDAATGALKAAAAAGNPLAFYEIGARFTEGRGVPVDLAKAADWYQRAADLGHAPSQYRIANFYEKGSGLERDLDAAKKWYQLAAEQGNASAMHNLAVLYAAAGAVPDYDSAARWFDRAAEVGVRDSQVNLAILYARGDGVARDLEKSYKWFAIAANDGDKDAAVKRDEVFNALRPEQAEAARASVANWTAEPINPDANEVEVPASWQGASTETAAVDMGKAIRNIQAILNNNGFDAGPPDGVMGNRTVSAIKQFQTSIGLDPTGEIDDRLVQELLARNG